MKINVHIERLVLEDIDIKAHQKTALKAALASELTQQLAAHGASDRLQSNDGRESVSGGSISTRDSGLAADLGQQIGHAVYRGIGK